MFAAGWQIVDAGRNAPFIRAKQVERFGAAGTRNDKGDRKGRPGRRCTKTSCSHHQGLAVDRLVHLGGLVPRKPTRVLTEAAIMGQSATNCAA